MLHFNGESCTTVSIQVEALGLIFELKLDLWHEFAGPFAKKLEFQLNSIKNFDMCCSWKLNVVFATPCVSAGAFSSVPLVGHLLGMSLDLVGASRYKIDTTTDSLRKNMIFSGRFPGRKSQILVSGFCWCFQVVVAFKKGKVQLACPCRSASGMPLWNCHWHALTESPVECHV